MNYKPLSLKPKTFFIDIDGVIIEQGTRWDDGNMPGEYDCFEVAGSAETVNRWKADGNRIVLTTARAEPLRARTECQLEQIGVHYDLLIMGLPNGQRILINDRKPTEKEIPTAIAINVDRDVGLAGVEI